ncbi:FecR family protein [Parapedobacter sp. 2B3]|uniref:FecR family protein n=1 Tax=Parapedobacter sp. 2B3 TaxID=3342381 RepID=UPI0035B5C3A1
MDDRERYNEDQQADRISRTLARLMHGGELNETEQSELKQWLLADERHQALFDSLGSGPALVDALSTFAKADTDAAFARVREQWAEPALRSSGKVRKLLRWLPYAAAVVVAIGTVMWYIHKEGGVQPPEIAHTSTKDIPAGGNRAVLQLADGRTINLDETQTGIVVGGDDITYLDGTSVATSLVADDEVDAEEMVLSTPKGGTYQIALPDGSKVWLNAASTLKYPSRFSAKERVVELVGEAYFDVVKDERTPFKVVSAGQTVEVLGTEFNVSAYPDEEAINTTLVEGSVRVALAGGDQSPVVIRPGQQATTHKSSLNVSEVDIFDYTAWKDGIIVLNSARLPDVMRQVERWYDVAIALPALKTDKTAYVIINRNESLSSVLKALEETYGVKLKLEGRRVSLID